MRGKSRRLGRRSAREDLAATGTARRDEGQTAHLALHAEACLGAGSEGGFAGALAAALEGTHTTVAGFLKKVRHGFDPLMRWCLVADCATAFCVMMTQPCAAPVSKSRRESAHIAPFF